MKKIKVGIGHYIFASNVQDFRIHEYKDGEHKGKATIYFYIIGAKETDKPVFSDKFENVAAAEAFIEQM